MIVCTWQSICYNIAIILYGGITVLDRKVFTLRTSEKTIDKLSIIAEENKRSANAQLELILEQYISNYEKENGKIKINSEV